MNKVSKLTLSVPKQVLRHAKNYARIHNTSISSIVTKLFESIYEEVSIRKSKAKSIGNALITDSSVGIISLPQKTSKTQLISNAVSEKFRKP